MNIIKTNLDITNKRMMYSATHGKAEKVNDLEADSIIPMSAYVVYEDMDSKGVTKLVATFTHDGKKYASASPTFVKSLLDIIGFMDGEDFEIVIKKAISKSGRQFLDCELAF